MSELFQAVKNLIFFLLLVTVFSNLLGKSSFKKYIHIFVGLIVIIIVIKPVLKWTNSIDKVDHYYAMNMYQNDAKDISAEIVGAEEGYQKQVVESYKAAIYSQIEVQIGNYGLSIENLEVAIDADTTSETCGQVTSIVLIASENQVDKESESKIDPIDQITIDKVNIHESSETDSEVKGQARDVDRYDTVLELEVKQELVALYGVPMDQLSVTIHQ